MKDSEIYFRAARLQSSCSPMRSRHGVTSNPAAGRTAQSARSADSVSASMREIALDEEAE